MAWAGTGLLWTVSGGIRSGHLRMDRAEVSVGTESAFGDSKLLIDVERARFGELRLGYYG